MTGKTYEQILSLERQGASLEKLYDSTKRVKIFSGSDSRGVAEYPVTTIDVTHLNHFSGDALKVGESVAVRLSSGSEDIRVVRADDAANPFRVFVGGREAFACDERTLSAHLELGDLFSRNGLGFLVPVAGELLRKASVRQGEAIGARDGTLS